MTQKYKTISYGYTVDYSGTAKMPVDLWEELQTNDDLHLSYGDSEGSIEVFDNAKGKVVWTSTELYKGFRWDCPHGVEYEVMEVA